MKTTLLLTLTLASSLLLSCKKDPEDPANWECEDNAGCAEKQICSEKSHQCLDVGCVTSADCGLSRYCDTKAHQCAEGCLSTDDCRAGEKCNAVSGTCAPYGCRSTQLDCAYGEFCNTETGQCYKPSQEYCESCNAARETTCGGNTMCIYYQGDRPQDGWCIVECNLNAADPCPRGFECVENPGFNYCQADCAWILENGYL